MKFTLEQRQALGRFGARARAVIGSVLVLGCVGTAVIGQAHAKKDPPAAVKITEEQASASALKAMPGKVTGVTIEKKRGKNVYVVEIMTEAQGEKDVFVDMVSGKVVGTD